MMTEAGVTFHLERIGRQEHRMRRVVSVGTGPAQRGWTGWRPALAATGYLATSLLGAELRAERGISRA